MDREFLTDQLKNLEDSIRLLAKGKKSLLLEPLDPEIKTDLEHVKNYLINRETKPSVPESIRARLSEGKPSEQERAPKPQTPSIASHPTESISSQEFDPLSASNLDSLRFRLRTCERCQLCQHRSTVVFGQGNQKAGLVFIGEGPGEEEDRTGLAFVGKAGKLLTQMIHSIGLNRDSVYICNIVKCRPPGNRNPEAEEISSCSPFLYKQLELLKPKLIVTLGNVATKTLIPDALGIMRMRGNMTSFQGIPLIPTFHPSYLLRNQKALADVWNDMRLIRQQLYKQLSSNDDS